MLGEEAEAVNRSKPLLPHPKDDSCFSAQKDFDVCRRHTGVERVMGFWTYPPKGRLACRSMT